MAEPERRRRRPPVSCVLCRRRKIRCDRENPCSNCVKSRSGNCVYDSHSPAPLQLGRGARRESHYPTPTSSSTGAAAAIPSQTSSSSPRADSSASSQEIELLRDKIRQLEGQLAKAKQTPRSPDTSSKSIETITSHLSGTFHIHHDDQQSGQHRVVSRSVTHKTRVFGQSHWVTGFLLVPDIVELIGPYVREESSNIYTLLQKGKSLARRIKARLTPLWPTIPSADLPPKEVADELVDHYLRAIEPIYRILHVPTFKRDYEALWISPPESSTTFLVQLKLVLAIGATMRDDQYSLRISAMRWVYEAQTWISEPGLKHRLNLQFMQINILLLLARELADVGPDTVWVLSGTLLRAAISMGLHKDPTRLPKVTTFTAEMRRRLWNTIIELSLQYSLISGGPPLITLDMFDTHPPGNYDDEQITTEDAAAKPDETYTQTSLAIALRKTFPARLAIAKLLNDNSAHNTYAETLRLDAELRASYKPILRSFQAYKSSDGLRPSDIEMDMMGVIMNRYILSLHNPFFGPTMQEAAYAFSRKVVIETSLKIWRTINPLPSTVSSSSQPELRRLSVCATGFFRIAALQANVLISTELIIQGREEDTLGPELVRPDLLAVLEEAQAWSLDCIKAGETSIKGYIVACMLAAQVDGLMKGLRMEEVAPLLVKAVEDAEHRSVALLEEMETQLQNKGVAQELEQTPPSYEMEGWDLPVSRRFPTES
ncbi:hypothetical protein M426DRAFT_151853 [Hypoxylon sp. CI-4A]|nr:hypothetical protein M426DRAFT_151853 [Hypoxylon sp. CI-4A]